MYKFLFIVQFISYFIESTTAMSINMYLLAGGDLELSHVCVSVLVKILNENFYDVVAVTEKGEIV